MKNYNKEKRLFGEIANVPEGAVFATRKDLASSKIHKPLQAGISGSGKEGADSIVISGGYEDDEDYGNVIIYTGHGGRNSDSQLQIADQTLTRQNLALALSAKEGLPVRVVRGVNKSSAYSPLEGYRYEGLYRVEEYWRDKGKRNYYVWRFRLRKMSDLLNEIVIDGESIESDRVAAPRVTTTIQRIVRDTKLSKEVKELYNYKCQICNCRIETGAGFYAEAAHIKPLGAPHNGPDVIENILCLCPNHHVMFDYGRISLSSDFEVVGLDGYILNLHEKHKIRREFSEYHYEHFYQEINTSIS